MKSRTILSAALLMVCCVYSGNNWAWGRHHGGGHFGFYFGAPIYPYYGYGYGYPYAYPYYPPAVVTVPVTPPTYIQQAPPVVQQNPSAYWHYCNSPQGYYPYIKECPGGWQLVEPTPR